MEAATRPLVHPGVMPGVWMRRPRMTGGFVVVYLFLALAFATIPPLVKSSMSLPEVIALMAPFVLYFAVVAWRYRRSGLLISNEGVRVRGVTRDRSLSLREARSFEVGVIGSPGALQAAYGIYLNRERGRPVLIRSLSRYGWARRQEFEQAKAEWTPVADALNELLTEVKGNAAPPAR